MPADPTRAVVLLDKPAGITSFRAARAAARRFGVRKAGHTGTLDAGVTGVLVVALGEATKAISQLVGLDKGYEGTVRFDAPVDEEALRAAMARFVGRIVQVPPLRSAVKRRPRERTVHRFEPTAFRGAEADFIAEVQAGTYVRALLRDLGTALGREVRMAALRRTFVGPFHIEECRPLDALRPEHAIGVVEALERVGLARVTIGPDQERAVRQGKPLPADGPPPDDAETRVLVNGRGHIVALARWREEGLRPFRVFAPIPPGAAQPSRPPA